MTGVSRNTILAWERRYGLPQPRRLPNGYRVYSPDDVQLLQRAKALTDAGHRIGEAVRILRVQSTAAIAAPTDDDATGRDTLLRHLLAFDLEAAKRVSQHFSILPFEAQLRRIYLPMMHEVGTLWQADQISISQEHFVSAFCRERMVTMFHALGSGPSGGSEMWCAGWPGEEHELGLLAVAIELALRAFRINYLGPNLPTHELLRLIDSREPAIVGQSMIAQHDAQEIYDTSRQIAQQIRGRTVLVLGGPGVAELADRSTPHLWFCPTIDDFMDRWTDHQSAQPHRLRPAR